MTRLTRGYLSGNYSTIEQKCDCVESDKLGFYKAINKLGQLEDIEEELGIDLITLFKAMKNGFYGYLYGRKLGAEEFDKIVFYETKKIGYLGNPRIFIKLYPKEMEIVVGYQEYCFSFNFKDYGKTRALTKEELENE